MYINYVSLYICTNSECTSSQAYDTTTFIVLIFQPLDTMVALNVGQNPRPDLQQEKTQSPDSEETAEEQQLQRDLKHLDLLLIRCRDMRTTIPRMLSGLPEVARNNQESLETMFGELVNHLKSAGTEIQDFTTLYTSEENKKVLEKAKKSRDANPKGIKTWLYKDHPDWADMPQ
ncbi:hypothetical protein GGR55DRAFT_628439 [Xylaria sp. FL0064]|nr:hypothetical protein GGR55DRAFT_628439 [Xylaria sp. FL0064]